MPTATLRAVLTRATPHFGGADADLLDRYRSVRDEDAFEALVVRHGPTVLGVCLRVLRDRHAADDAFQATFLVLARKASAVRPPELIGAWLYGVAYRTALKARCRGFRRAAVERAATARRTEAIHEVPHRDGDLRPLIDEQIAGLPEKYRLPVILCVVQGASKADAAARLGLNEGTLSSRLARGRDMLRDRLERRGIAPSVALAVGGAMPGADLIAVTTEAGAAFGLGSAFGVSPAVLSLTNEVLGTMNTVAWKLAGVLVAMALAVGGTGFAVADGGKQKAAEKGKPAVKKPDGDKPKVGEGDKPKKDGEKGDTKRIVGTITEVNDTAKAINVSRKADTGEEKTIIAFTAGTKVFVNGKEAKLSDLPRNSLAEVAFKLNPDPKGLPTATEIRVAGKDRRLLLDKIDGKQLFYQTEGASRSFALADGVAVVIVGKESKLSDLKHGDAITATMSTDDATVLKIVVKKRTDGGDKQKDK